MHLWRLTSKYVALQYLPHLTDLIQNNSQTWQTWPTLEGVCPAHWGPSARRTQTPSGAVFFSWKPPSGWPDSRVSAAAGATDGTLFQCSTNSPQCWTKYLFKPTEDLKSAQTLAACYFLLPPMCQWLVCHYFQFYIRIENNVYTNI